MTSLPVSPVNIDRYELKYRIHSSMVDPISDYVAQYCEMDYYSKISPDGFYQINSLYLDTQSLYLFRAKDLQTLGFSCFRIRSYGEFPQPPYYFESKKKVLEFCQKRRGKVPIENFGDLFDNRSQVKDFDPYADRNVANFIQNVETLGLRPTVLTQYRRRAFLSRHDDYARVTFDRDLALQEEHSWNVRPDAKRMRHYDHPDTFADYNSGRHVILEIKCERKIPVWLIHLVRCFQLTHDRFSKYQGAIRDLNGNTDAPLAFDRVPNLQAL